MRIAEKERAPTNALVVIDIQTLCVEGIIASKLGKSRGCSR